LKIHWEKEKLEYNHLSLDFAAARNLIRAAFPVLVAKYLVKSKAKGKVVYPVVDWKPLFLNPAIQCYLMQYLGDDPIGFCVGYDTVNKREVKFFADTHACPFVFPPQRMRLEVMAKVVATEEPLPEDLARFYERYYK
jgi:ABC-type molybdate transport system permease subunit